MHEECSQKVEITLVDKKRKTKKKKKKKKKKNYRAPLKKICGLDGIPYGKLESAFSFFPSGRDFFMGMSNIAL